MNAARLPSGESASLRAPPRPAPPSAAGRRARRRLRRNARRFAVGLLGVHTMRRFVAVSTSTVDAPAAVVLRYQNLPSASHVGWTVRL